MKKFLILTSVILSVFCINLSYADCGPDDQDCKQVWSGPLTGHCNANDTVGTDCTTRHPKYPTRVSKAACEQGNASSLTCAAKCCKDPYYLVLKDGGRSQGICYSEKEAINFCKRCKEGNCVPVFEDRNINGCLQHVFVKCTKPTASTPPEPEQEQEQDSTCTLGFLNTEKVIQNVATGESWAVAYNPNDTTLPKSIYEDKSNKDITPTNNSLHLFDLKTIDGIDITDANIVNGSGNTQKTIDDLRNANHVTFTCNNGKNPFITILDTPVDETPTCELEFPNKLTIQDVSLAESIKTDALKTNVELWKLKTGRTETQSAYADKGKSVFQQNYSSSEQNYDPNTPHLFDLVSVTKKIGNQIQIYDVSPQQQSDFQNARYIKFDCNTEKFFTIYNGIKILSATVECTDKTQCNDLDVFNKIDKYTKYFEGKTSAWTNAEGGFNTARLASDSIAGVVLGTVGGIVTSKVIKKNQIKNGFEDLKCTIGGQDVATYGDEFTVGVK